MNAGLKKPLAGVLTAAFVAALGIAVTARTTAFEERTVYVTVLGGPGGGPMLDLNASNFQVQEDNVVREVTSIRAANEPVSAVLLYDTTPGAKDLVQDIRKAVLDYATTLLEMNPESRLALAEFGAVAMITTPFTSSLEEIRKAVPRIVAKTDGSSLLNEGLVEASKVLAKEATPRRVIVTINKEPAAEYSQIRLETVAEEVRKSGATVYSIQVLDGTRRDASRDQLLQALTTNSGGLKASIGSPTALQGLLNNIASLSGAQYAITIQRPDGSPAPKQTVIAVNREGARPLTNQWSGR
jgi:hypothetical protein